MPHHLHPCFKMKTPLARFPLLLAAFALFLALLLPAQAEYTRGGNNLGDGAMTSGDFGHFSVTRQANAGSSAWLQFTVDLGWDTNKTWKNGGGGSNAAVNSSKGVARRADQGGSSDLSVTTTNGRYYTFRLKGDNSWWSRDFVVMETTNSPVTISSVSANNATRYNTQNVTVTITTSGTPSSEEKIYVRYTTDSFTNSSLVQATGSGTSWTAVIPGTASNSTRVDYYVLTSTVADTTVDDDFDLWTLRGANNGGSNWNYTLATASAPTVTTNSTVTSIATTSATLGGNMTATGGANASTRGFEYSTTNNFSDGAGTTATDSGTYSSTGDFTKSITGLTANTLYYFKAQSTNPVGTGRGAQQSFTTLPNAPTVGSASSVSAAGFTASWTAPTSQGSATFTYSIEVSTNNSTFASPAFTQSSIASGTTTASVTGLAASTTYYFRVRAVNAGGNSAWSSGSAAVTTSSSATVPAVPTGVSITPGNQNLSVSFTPGDNGGSAITNYEYSVDGGAFVALSPTDTTSPVTVPNSATLVNGQSYNIRIRALNSVGNGTATANVSATPRTTPGAPTITGITSPSSGTLSVAFTAPGSNGGNSITTYQYSTNGGTNWQTRAAGTTGSPISISTLSTDGSTALTNGTSYNIQIRAVNDAGAGTATANSTGTPVGAPSVTTDAASSVGITTVTLGGNITSTNGASATTRGVEYSTTNNFSTGTGTQVSSSGTFGTGSYTQAITGLAKNTTYYFRAYATNAAGTTYGSQASFTTLNAPDGKNPTTANPTTAFLGDNKTLTVDSWQGFNGANNRSYATIFGRFDNTNLTSGTTEGPGVNPGASADSTSANTPRFAQTGTFYWAMRISYGGGVDYYFDASRADWSPLAASLPSSATLNIVVSALNPPSGLTATANGTTAIDLAWTKGTSGDAKDTIIVRRSGSAVATDPTNGVTYNANNSVGDGTVIYRGGLSAFQDTGLTPGVTYHYKIYSENWSYYSSGITANASLASNYDLNVATGNTETQSAVSGGAATLTGSAALNKLGGGTLELNSSSNSYTGVTTINNGTISITVAAPSGSNGALGNAASAVVIGGSGNSTTFNIGAAVTNSRSLSIESGGIRGISTSITSGTATQAGSTTSAANFNISVPSGGTLNITGNIDAGTSTIDKLDSGTAILAGTMSNTATLFDVMAGELQFASAAAIGNRSTGFLQNKFFFGGGTLGITGNITLGSDNGLYVGNNATSIIRVAANQTFEVQGYIQDPATGSNILAKTGPGTLYLNKTSVGDSNDFSNTTLAIREGTLDTWSTNMMAPNNSLGDTSTTGTLLFSRNTDQTTTGNFSIAAGGGIINTATNALTISGILSGSGNLTKAGNGDLALTGANTYTGNITISSGTLRINADSRLGADPTGARGNSISLGNAKFALDGAITLSSNRGITLTSTGAVIDTYGNDDTYNGIIASSGTTDLEKRGGGTLTLGGANTYTGSTSITVGALTITHASALGAVGTGNGTTVASGIALNLSGSIAVGNELLTINGTGISDGGALRSLSGTNSWSGAITLAANSRINTDANTLTLGGAIGAGANTLFVGGAGSTTINGNITGTQTAGNGALFLDSTATITLGGTNSALTGLTLLRAGTLSAAVANLPAGNIQIGNGATSATLSITGASATHSGNISVTDSSTAAVITIASGTTFTLSGTLGQTGSVNTTKIGKSGAGTLRLNSANSYAGQIQIGEGDVILANNTAHGTNTSTDARAIDLGLNVGDTSMGNAVSVFVTNGVTSGASIYVAANTSSATRTIGLSGSGTGAFSNQIYMDGTATLTGGSGTVTFSGNLTNTGGVTVSGGTVVLSGSANSYSGLTTVNSGAILQTSASDRIPSTGGLTLAGGTLRMVGAISDTLGTLNVTATSVIDLGNGANNVSLTFGAIGSISGGTLDIHNYTSGDTITFTSTTGLSSAVGSIRFFSDAGGTLVASSAVISGNTIVPTPTLTAVTLSTALTATFPNAGTGVSFTAAGSSLLGNITVTAQTGYEVSTALSSGYGASVSVAGGTTVYVRHAANRAAGDYNSATAAVLSSTSASNVNVTTSSSGNTIAKATPSITWSNPSAIEYGTALSATQLNATSPVAGSFSYSPASGAVVAAGAQTLNTTFTPTDTGNYTTATASVSLTVNTRAITITANNTSKTYGTTAPSGAGQTAFAITSGSMHGTDSIASVTLTYNGSPAGNATTAAPGTYSITPSAAVFGSGGSSNYTITYAPGTLTVNKANQTITGVAASESKTFGDAAYSLNATTDSNLTLAYSSSNTSVATVASNGTVTIVGVGTTTLTVNQTGDANYNAATNVTQALTVAARAITITANSTSKTFGDSAPAGTGQTAFTITSGSLVSPNSISSVTLTYNGSPAGNATTAAPGTYSITPSAAVFGNGSASNYAITYANGTLTVGKANQTISGVAASESKTFGDAAYSLNATTNSGLTLAYSSSNTSVATVAANGTVTIVGVGTTTLTVNQTGDANYNAATNATQTLTVAARAITITANSTSKTYGDSAPAGTGQTAFTITSGSLVSPNSITSVTLTYNGTPTGNATNAAVGTYSITPSAAVFGNGNASNYAITYANGTLTVGKANQTISGVAASESKTFGDAAYSLNATTNSGLTLAYSSSNTAVATVASNGTVTIVGVGTTTLTVNQTGDANYNAATNVTQALTVSAKALTITANSTSKAYGATAPSGTGQTAFTSSGLVGSDSISSVTLTYNGSPAGNATTAAPGTYSITPSAAVFGSGSASNYAITYANGTLTVGKANQTITGVAASESKTFGDAAYSLNATTSSGLTLAYTSSNTAVATVAANGTVTIVGVGSATLTVNQTGDANYNAATNVTQALTVAARAITITANNQTKSFGSSSSISGSSSDVTISSGTLVGTDAISSVTLTYNGTPAGNATTARAGTYTITPSALSLSPGSASNYAITYANGTLTINSVAPAVTTGTSGSITTTTAVITGSDVTSDGGGSISARGVVYGTSANPSLGGGNTSVADGSNTTGTFNSNLSGLTAGVTYHFRAYVTNGHSTVYGTSDSFSTPADVPAQVTLSRADNPTSTGFRVKWTDVANETGYHLEYATTANYTGSTLVSNIAANATSHELTGLTSGNLYYVRVRGVSAGGNGTWSANQTNQLQSIGANVTRYMSAPGATDSGSYTVADIFGSNNEAGLASGANTSSATTIKLVGSNGTTGAAIFRNNSNQWQQGSSTTAGTLEVGRGKAFILENKSGSTDHFLLVGTSTNVTPPAVAIDNTATLALVASGRTTPTPLATFVQNLTPTASPTLSTHFKAATNAANADQIIIPAQPGQPAQIFFYHPSAKGGAGWFVNGKRVTTETIPAGAGVFIRKASGSTLQSFTPPAE